MSPSAAPPSAAGDDRLAAVYQLKIHLLGIDPQISRQVLVRGDTTLAELHHVFQLAMGWENWHLHSFKLWGREYGIPYAGGIYFAGDARWVHLGDFPWRAGDRFTYTYNFGDYWHHQVRVEKVLPGVALVIGQRITARQLTGEISLRFQARAAQLERSKLLGVATRFTCYSTGR